MRVRDLRVQDNGSVLLHRHSVCNPVLDSAVDHVLLLTPSGATLREAVCLLVHVVLQGPDVPGLRIPGLRKLLRGCVAGCGAGSAHHRLQTLPATRHLTILRTGELRNFCSASRHFALHARTGTFGLS